MKKMKKEDRGEISVRWIKKKCLKINIKYLSHRTKSNKPSDDSK